MMKRSKNKTAFGRLNGFIEINRLLRRVVLILITFGAASATLAHAQEKTPLPNGVHATPPSVKSDRDSYTPVRNDRPETEQEKANHAKNVLYATPPATGPLAKPRAKVTRQPPAPYSGPKTTPASIVTRGPLPRGAHEQAEKEENEEKEEPDNLIRAWQNRRPMSEVQKAVHESLTMPSEPRRTTTSQNVATPLASPNVLSTDGWEQVGDGDYNADGVHYQAGRIRQASYAYDNNSGLTVLWLGATGGGLWKAVNVLTNPQFVPMSDNLPGSPSVGAFLVQPGNSNNILIGSGDTYRYGGTGMYKTSDGGATWYSRYPTDGTSWPSAFQKVLIDLNDTTGQTVLAEGDGGIWRSTDFGDSWTQVYNGSTTDLVQDPVNTYIWYAGAPGIGVLRSTSYGTSFSATGSGIAGPVGRVGVAVSASSPEHVYAITAFVVQGISQTLGGIWRSDDYGDGTWNLIEPTDNISGAGQAFHTTSINVDPSNADLVFAGMANSEVTYNGTSATPTWSYSNNGNFDEGHADHTGYLFEPNSNNVISTTDGGVYVLNKESLGVSGSLNYGTGLNVQQVFIPVGDLACSLDEPDQCVSGLQDNGSITINRNNTPALVNVGGGDGGQTSIAPNDASEMFVMADGARSYTTNGFNTEVGDYGNCLSSNFYASTMIDQTPPNGFTPYIYTISVPGSGGKLSYVYYKPVDSNCDWAAANPNAGFITSYFNPRTMDASNDPNAYVFYVGGWGTATLNVLDSYSTGAIGNMTYLDRTPPLASNSTFSDSQIAADRSDSRPYTVTYVTGGSRPSQAFLSNDRGTTWSEVTGDLTSKLPSASYWKLVANPEDQSQLFLATDQGVYRSDNFGVNWYRYMNGMPAVTDIYGMELNYDYANPPLLHIGTLGRGFWDRQVAADAALTGITITPTPVVGGQNVAVTVNLSQPAPQDTNIQLISSNYSILPVSSYIQVAQGNTTGFLSYQTSAVDATSTVSVTASYNEVSYTASATVTQAPTTTSVASSSNPSNPGQAITFKATVGSSYGSPTGSVAFYDGGSYLGSGTLSGNSSFFSESRLTSGTHSITAVYQGAGSFLASSSSALSQTVKYATSTGLALSIAHSVYGQPITVTATVSTKGTPSGAVTFKEGGTTLGTANLSGVHATLTTSNLTVGTHAITASYDGSTNYTSSTSGTLSQVVSKVATSNSISASANPTVYGRSVSFTARLKTATGIAPTGSITFKDGGTTLGTLTLNDGEATLETSTLSIGSHSITAIYAGNADIDGRTSSALAHIVEKTTSITSLSGTPNPSKFKQAVLFTATVKSSTEGIPGGSVTFKDGGTTLATLALNSHGIATYTDSALIVGSHSLTATYAGNTNFDASTSTKLLQTVEKETSQTSVTANPNPSKVGQAVILTGEVKATEGGAVSGSAVFKDGSNTLATVKLNAEGVATWSDSALSAGTHSLTAAYEGDTDILASTSTVLTHVVEKVSSETSVVASLSTSAFNQSVTFTAKVKSSGTGTPTGTVTFKNNGTILATVTLNNSGAASYSDSLLTVGKHAFTVVYAGNNELLTSTSASLSHTVEKSTTTTNLTSALNPSKKGQAVVYTATISPAFGGSVTGKVTFKDGSKALGSVNVTTTDRRASFTTSALGLGTHHVTAGYEGSDDFNLSTSAVLDQVVKE